MTSHNAGFARTARCLAAAGLWALFGTLAPAVEAGHWQAPAVQAAPDPSAAKAGIQELLQRMTAAVAAADQTGYLACVDQTDSDFATEQMNWAKDLGRKPVESFDLGLEGDPSIEPDGSARAKLKTVWRMPGGGERTMSFPARFVRGSGGWLYAGEWWNIKEGERVRVLYEGDELAGVAAAVAEVLPEIRAHVHEGFELTEDRDLTERVQQVKLYTSMRHLQHSIYLSYTDGLSGWNEPGEAIKILARPGTGKGMLRMLLAHEYGHVATFQLGPKANDMPWWILEGVAEMASERYSKGGESTDSRVRQWARRDNLVDWEDLADFHGEAANHYAHVYTQGHQMIRYISGRFGRTARNGWMRAMSRGANLDRATLEALGLSFDQLDQDWRKSLRPEGADKPAPESAEEPAGAGAPAGKP